MTGGLKAKGRLGSMSLGGGAGGVRIFVTRQRRGVGSSTVFSFCLLWEGKRRGPRE